MLDKEIILRPILTEKTYQGFEKRKYTFEVYPGANKIEIAKAVERAFNVKVEKVNTLWVKPKPRRYGRYLGKTRKWKKAIVTLAAGQKIDFFEGL